MSARDKIHARLFKWPNENRDDLIDELLREHAHELAEELRGFGMEDAGNFIDPEGAQ